MGSLLTIFYLFILSEKSHTVRNSKAIFFSIVRIYEPQESHKPQVPLANFSGTTIGLGTHKSPKQRCFLLPRLGHNLSLFPSPWVALPHGSTQLPLPKEATYFKMHSLLCSRGSGASLLRQPALFWVRFGSIYQHFKHVCLRPSRWCHSDNYKSILQKH